RYLYFPGCKLTPFLPEYDRSTRAVLAALDIDLDDTELNCCGYPVRHNDFTAAMLCGTRVLAMAARKGLPLLTPCKCCYGNLKQADYWMRHNSALRHQINALLGNEGLYWREDLVVRHLLTALDEDVGRERLAARVRRPLMGLKVAAHYGCHALRPGDVTQFDNPLAPTVFERVVAVTGAQSVEWPLRLDCCGQPLWEKNNPLALTLMRRKLADAHESGARVMVTACTYCQLQLDGVRREHPAPGEAWNDLPVVLVSQMLAVAFGLPGFEMEGVV
ncbi:MAG: CoB--CoM heterodisulfide reductase iron-sulfur subunit B family protein, partial [Desulfatitalea sp.]